MVRYEDVSARSVGVRNDTFGRLLAFLGVSGGMSVAMARRCCVPEAVDGAATGGDRVGGDACAHDISERGVHHTAGVRLSCNPLHAPLIAKAELWRTQPLLVAAAHHTMRCSAQTSPAVNRSLHALVRAFGYFEEDAIVRAALGEMLGSRWQASPVSEPVPASVPVPRVDCVRWLKADAARFFREWPNANARGQQP